MEIELFSQVKVVIDIPESGLSAGDEATVVEVFPERDDRPAGYMIELPSSHPHYAIDAVPTVTAGQIEAISPAPDWAKEEVLTSSAG
ncbi:MAG: DUF4926 domain-containing protein [Cyanobacteria bacterium P01_A01_bin.17]